MVHLLWFIRILHWTGLGLLLTGKAQSMCQSRRLKSCAGPTSRPWFRHDEDSQIESGSGRGHILRGGASPTSCGGSSSRLSPPGGDAIETITELVPDLVLLDLQLPDMTGLDVLRTLGERGVPVTAVVVTAHGSINTAVEAMQAGRSTSSSNPSTRTACRSPWNALERQELTQSSDAAVRVRTEPVSHGFIGSSGCRLLMRQPVPRRPCSSLERVGPVRKSAPRPSMHKARGPRHGSSL